MMQNGTGRGVRTVVFDNAKELVAGRTGEARDSDYLVPYSPSSNGVAKRLVGVTTNGTRAMLRDSNLPPRFWAKAMTTFYIPVEPDANKDERGDNVV